MIIGRIDIFVSIHNIHRILATMLSYYQQYFAERQQAFEEAVIPELIRQQYLPTWWPVPVLLYMLAEVAFYIYFKTVMVPYANQIIPPSEYRDYGRDRHKLVLRILERVARTARVTGKDELEETARFLIQWFYYAPNHMAKEGRHQDKQLQKAVQKLKQSRACKKPELLRPLSGSSMGSSSVCSSDGSTSSLEGNATTGTAATEFDDSASDSGSLDDDDDDDSVLSTTSDEGKEGDEDTSGPWTVTVLGKADIDDFMAWGFFGKFVTGLQEWEVAEMEQCYKVLEDMYGIIFKPGRSPNYKLRYLLSLEKCVAMHRPLAYYAQVNLVKWGGSQLFRMAGFSRYVSSQGIVCWYKPAADDDYSRTLLPLLIFHGVGPGGHALYTLMVLLGLNRTGRAILMFENHSVSCTLNFKAKTEQETIASVQEMVDKFFGPEREVSLLGHSFGTSTLTWLLHSQMKPRIRQMVILEPVSIMLSESDVIVNIAKPLFKMAIDLVLEHYIRRQYPWYNSELWLEDIPEDTHVIIGLAGKDPIINSFKIKQEIEVFCAVNPKIARNIDFIYWKNNIHGACLGLPWCWKDINNAMLKQDLAMLQSPRSRSKRQQLRKQSQLSR